jgi:hypothetical protein
VELCPQCGHRRSALEVVPDWQCPACGVVYAKWRPEPRAEPPRPRWGRGSWLDESLASSESARSWKVFVFLQILLAYLAVRYTADAQYSCLIDLCLAPVHEMGHFVCQGLGTFIYVLGGSLFQWGFPLAITLGFLKRRDLYAVCVGLFLMGVSISESYVYMDSSFQMEKYPNLTFVSLGDGEGVHDWQYLFGALKMYRSYTTVAMGMRVLGLLLIWMGVFGGAWLLWRMIRALRRA